MTKDEALKLALEVMQNQGDVSVDEWIATEKAIKEALAEPEQEPVAFINVEQRKLEWAKYMSWDTPTVVNLPKIPLYAPPPHRTWVGLTDEEIDGMVEITDLSGAYYYDDLLALARAIEAKLKDKNVQR